MVVNLPAQTEEIRGESYDEYIFFAFFGGLTARPPFKLLLSGIAFSYWEVVLSVEVTFVDVEECYMEELEVAVLDIAGVLIAIVLIVIATKSLCFDSRANSWLYIGEDLK